MIFIFWMLSFHSPFRIWKVASGRWWRSQTDFIISFPTVFSQHFHTYFEIRITSCYNRPLFSSPFFLTRLETSQRESHVIPCLSRVCVLNCCYVQLFVIPWSVACQASLYMEFSRQEYWGGLPFPSQGDLPNPGIKPGWILYWLSLQGNLNLASAQGDDGVNDYFHSDGLHVWSKTSSTYQWENA